MSLRLFAYCAVGIALLSGCSSETTPTSSHPVDPTTTTVDPQQLVPPCMLGEDGFFDDGTIVVGEELGDAAQIERISWTSAAGCDHIEVSFLTAEGAPASAVGTATVSYSPSRGTVRIELPEAVTATGPVDALIDGRLATAAYVVDLTGGRLAVDVHVAGDRPVIVRASAESGPARTVIDIRPVDAGRVPSPPRATSTLVVVEPPASVTTYPFDVRGYVLTTTGEVSITLSGGAAGGESTRTTVAAGTGERWGEFWVTLTDGPLGEISLTVDAAGAVVELPLTLE